MPAYSAGKVTYATRKWFHSSQEKSRPNMFPSKLRLPFAIAVVGLESLVLWVLAAVSLYETIFSKPLSITSALFLVGILVAAGLWSANIAFGLGKLKRWAHTPAVILQLLIASIGFASFFGKFGNFAIGAALMTPTAIALYALLSKSVFEKFRREIS